MNIKNLFLGNLPSILSIDDYTLDSININTASALSIAAFYQGVSTLSNTIASLPFKVYHDKEVQRESNVHYLLKEKPNSYQTAFEFFNTMIFLMLLKGNSFAYIQRNEKGETESLEIADFFSVAAILSDGKLFYKFDNDSNRVFASADLIHFKNIGNGFLGVDPITNFKKNLEVNLNAIEYTNKVYNGEASSIRGTITYDKALTLPQKESLRSELQSNFSGKGGKRVLFLEDGMKLDSINLDPSQTKFLESRTFEKSEIASMLNVPPFVVGDYSNPYSNVELQNLHLYQQTLLPIITKIEAELKHKLFTRKEVTRGYYVKCNVESLLRGDTKSRAEFYKQLFYLGAISSEEIRDKEDMESEVNGTAYIHSNLIPTGISHAYWESLKGKNLSKAGSDPLNVNEEQI